MATLQANKDVVRRFYEGWNRGAIDFEAFVADEIVNYQPEAEPERGRDRFAAAIRGVMNAVPDSRWDVVEAIAEDDRVVVRITWSGTYNAPQFRGASIPEPARFSVEHIHIYRVADGRLAEHSVVRDDLTMLKQLHAITG
jgi:steroid delta-isomerase-like uncharacterized protein